MSDLSDQDKSSLKELLDQIPEGPHKITNREKDAIRIAFLNDLNITWLVSDNPKQRNSKAKFALYWQEGKNDIVAAKANGMTWADYLNDFEKGYFRINTVVLDQNPELAAVLMDPVTTESVDSLSKPSQRSIRRTRVCTRHPCYPQEYGPVQIQKRCANYIYM